MGIHLYHSSNNTISDNTANDNGYGIRLQASSYNNLTGNTANNNYDFGIDLLYSSYNNLYNNIANNTFIGIYLFSSSHNNLKNNTANNNTEKGIYLYKSSYNILNSNTLLHNKDDGIAIVDDSDWNIIKSTNLSNNSNHNVLLKSSNYNIILQSHISKSTFGTYEYGTDFNEIIQNNIKNNAYGIYAYNSINNTYLHNNLLDNSEFNFYNNQSYNITAELNWWGTNVENEIADTIYDYYDDSSKGIVDFDPWLNTSHYSHANIQEIECREDSTWINCNNLQYNDTLTKVRVNCTAEIGTVTSARFKLRNIEDDKTFFDQETNNTENGWFVYDNDDLEMTDSGHWRLYVECKDQFNNVTHDIEQWFFPFGYLEAYLIEPASNFNVNRFKYFNFSTGVKCVGGECGNVSATLDPENLIQYKPSDEILLKSRKFIPDDLRLQKGLGSLILEKISSEKEREHILIQFDNLLSINEKRLLEEEGIKFLRYIPNKAWLVSRPVDKKIEIPNAR